MRLNMSQDMAREFMRHVPAHSATGMVNLKLFEYINQEMAPWDAGSKLIERVRDLSVGTDDLGKRLSIMGDMSDTAALYGLLYKTIDNIIDTAGFGSVLRDDLIKKYALEMKLFSGRDISENPYVKDIKFDGAAAGDFEYRWQQYERHELTMYDMPFHDGVCDIMRLGMFIEPTRYPSIGQKSLRRTWMSVTPNEIHTMADSLNHAHGKVLTLGLGMGYFAYMASRIEEVDSIDVVEIDPDVIKLFEDYILPQFEFKNKIHIINDDAVEYLKNYKDGTHDYCFADTWIGADDLAGYFRIKEASRGFMETRFEYWIERSFASYLSSYLWMLMMRESGLMPIGPILGTDYRTGAYIEELYNPVEIFKSDGIVKIMNPDDVIRRITRTKVIY